MPFLTFETVTHVVNASLAGQKPLRVLAGQAGQLGNVLKPKFSGPLVRRPYNGLHLKARAPANITVIKENGDVVLMYNGLGGRKSPDSNFGTQDNYYNDFTLLQITEAREEKMQVVETFGEDFVFFFGERPRFIACAGVLANAIDFNWRAEFWENYDKYLRGTKLVEAKAKVYLSWDDIMVEGYIVRAQAVDNASDPYAIPFNFAMLITGYFSLAALNFSALTQLKNSSESAEASDFAGSRATDMFNNSQPVELEEPFWKRQLSAAFGYDNPDQAVRALIQEGPEAFGKRMTASDSPTMGYFKAGGPLTNGANEYMPGPAPVKHMFVRSANDAHNTEAVAKRSNAKRVLGETFQTSYAITKVAL